MLAKLVEDQNHWVTRFESHSGAALCHRELQNFGYSVLNLIESMRRNRLFRG